MMTNQQNNMKEEEINCSSSTARFKSKTNNQLDLSPQNLNSRLAKKIRSKKLIFLQGTTSENHNHIYRSLAKALKSELDLRELEISTTERDVDMNDQNLFHISKALYCLDSLQILNLTLRNASGITDSGIELLCQSLKRTLRLKTLSLCFPSHASQITDLGVYKISKSLQLLTCLEHLTLEFGNSDRITAKGAKFIRRSLEKLASSLLNLRFRFIGCTNVEDQALSHLGEGINCLNRLENLDIGFPFGSMLSQDGIKNFFEGLKNPLKSFSLDTSYSYLIKEETLKHFSDLLKRNEGLENLDCVFVFNNHVTNAGLDFLQQGLQRLKNLQRMSLNFSNCGVADYGITRLCDSLTSLKSLNLAFKNCTKITDRGISRLGKPCSQF